MGGARRAAAQAVAWSLAPLLLAGTLLVQARPGSAAFGADDVPGLLALAACWVVGVVVTWRASSQPSGWALLGLGTALAWSAFTDEYAPPGDPHPLPGYALVATLGDSSFVWWFVFLALVLQLTPPEPGTGAVARRLPAVTLVSGLGFQVMALLRSRHLDAPHQDLVSPWAVDALERPIAIAGAVAVYVLGVALIASAVTLVRAWRRSRGESRRRMLWLVAGAIPVPPVVVAAFVLSWGGQEGLAGALLGAAIACLVAGAALSVLRYRLYDVERVVTESAAYAIASGVVLGVFVLVVLVISTSTPLDARAQLPAVAGTLAAVATARASYVWGRRAVGRRVNRRRFDAVELVRAGLAAQAADLDELLVSALGAGARVVYPSGAGGWVTSDGREAAPSGSFIEVRRHGALTARLEHDPAGSDVEVAEAVAAVAAPEIDNVALRAELARQVEVVTESRARLATAHLEERRRIERDLHDGAQQRLLAIAMQLQAARLNGGAQGLAHEVDRAVSGLGDTVQELRDLAAGLQPAALAGGGLLGAVVDLAGRLPVRVEYDVVDQRFPPHVEAAAWFVIAEAIANVVKHAGTDGARITLTSCDEGLRVHVVDRGVGGADPHGHGLSGLADRVAALRGTLSVREAVPHGTEVEAVLPCAS